MKVLVAGKFMEWSIGQRVLILIIPEWKLGG